uniref:NADH-ubiquinone oxidoreductase chain 6 n=1 Tax=Epilachna admirabilis TaxID=77537 RepID=A0A6B9MWB7_9CUCU|nr:NADH dehydrogenase subunit 6 [Epilachna admirabilis]
MFLLMFILTSSIIIFLNHPLSMGFLILIQSIIMSMSLGSLTFNYWYSYILMLIMIGGLLILFIYMTSIASNEKFKFNFIIFFMSMIIFSTMMFSIKDPLILNNFHLKNDLILNYNNTYNFNLSMSKFYNIPYLKIMLITIIYLLITMIASVKICKINMGPLRQMFYENTNSKNLSFTKNY